MTRHTRLLGNHPRRIAIPVVLATLSSFAVLLTVAPAHAAIGTVLFDNQFNDRTVDGTGTVTKPTSPSGTNTACLTALGNFVANPLASCSGTLDLQGNGKLRLTNTNTNQIGAIYGQTSFPTSNGLDVTFNSYQWGGNSGDGISFVLAAIDPANPAPPPSVGPYGGSLGYTPAGTIKGLANGYLGVGLDVFGNYSSSSFSGTGCTNPPNFGVVTPGAMAVRGPGNNLVNYCGLATTYNGTPASKLALHATGRAASQVPVQVLINPTNSVYTSPSGVSVDPGSYKAVITPIGQPTRSIGGLLPTVPAGLYPSSTWLNPAGVPKQLAFGFVGSTGSVVDNHEIDNVKVLTFNPVPQLDVSTTSFNGSVPQQGGPVTYRSVASVLAGADESSTISLNQTTPTGVRPVGAFGVGWVCQPPVGQNVTCTTSGSSFPGGTVLPAVTVVAIVTGTGVTSDQIQNNSSTTVSSTDAAPGTDSVMSAGTLPTAPAGITVTPSSGLVAGGGSVIVGGTHIVAATAIEIGTTSEQQAGTPVVLLPCPGAAAAGCFTVSGSTLVISSMPGRGTAVPTSVTVVTSGVAAAASYAYVDRPGTPAAPTAVAGLASATVSWVAPADNGSPITAYTVTPYRTGVAQSPIVYDATTTTRTLTGLTVGSAYTFTVAATNAIGTSLESAKSNGVVPYTFPGAPTITAVSAGDSAATLTWTAPSTGGTPITGYLVTPYIGLVAQPAQAFTGSGTTQTATGLTPGTAYTFTVAAQNLAGTGPPSAKSASVIPNVSPSLNFPDPPPGEVGAAYSRQLTVTDGTSPFVWSVSVGTLPPGLTLNASTGLLSGTPTASGSYPFTVKVVDASSQSATKAVTVFIAAAPVITFAPAAGEVAVPYSQTPAVTGGTGPFSWAVVAGSLPAGLTLNPVTGAISGTPTASGSFSVTIRVTDALSQTASKSVTLQIVALPTFDGPQPPAGQQGVEYTTTFTVTGGSLPLTWSVVAGSLPPGLTLSSTTGVLSGVPTAVGSSSFTVAVIDAAGQTATKAVTLVILGGPLVIVKTADVSVAAAGAKVTYTITVSNTGTTSRSGVALSDPLGAVLDDAVYNADGTATSGALTFASGTLGWTGNLAAGSAVTISYSVTVNNPDVGNRILTNTATSSTLGTNCAPGSTDLRCSVRVEVPGLTIVKTADVATTTPGATIHLQVVVTNTGPTTYPAATLTDGLAGMLDDGSYPGDATATSGSLSYTPPGLTWTGALAPGASATIAYSFTVATPDLGDRSVTGTVVSSSLGSTCPLDNPAPSCTATVRVLVPALSITNIANVTETTPGGSVGYTVTLANTGQTAYGASTSVAVKLADALDDAAYDGNATASAGSVVFDAGSSSLVWTGALAIGAVVTITGSVTVSTPDAGDRVMVTTAVSSAVGNTCPVVGGSPACTSTVHVQIPGLRIQTSADATTTTPGSVVHYTVSLTNTGQTAYAGAALRSVLAGVLDDATYRGDVAASGGSAAINGGILTWSGDLLVGASVSITYSVLVHDPDVGDRTMTATVTSTTPGNTCQPGSTDPFCSTSVAVLVPGLTLVCSVADSTTTPGSVVYYTLDLTNTGETTYSSVAVTLELTGALDDATYNYDATITAGSLVTNPDGTVDWVLSLTPGEHETGKVSFTVNEPDTGDRLVAIAAVSDAPGSQCPTGSTNPSCVAVATVLLPGLTITKTADSSTVSPGEAVTYTITVTNNGQTTYPAASLQDDLSGVLTDAIYAGGATATTGTVSYAAPVLSWTGTLAPGAAATISYLVTVRDPDPGDKRMLNTVVSSTRGNNCTLGSTDPACTATVRVLVPGLTLETTADAATSAPAAVIGYTVTARNSGATGFAAAAFSESLAGLLDDATYNGDAAVSSGSVTHTGNQLNWSGALAVGATVTLTYSVTVHAADVGDDLVSNTVTSSTAGNNCFVGSPDPRCGSTVPVARLTLVQTYSASTTTPGSLLAIDALFTNSGQVAYTGISISLKTADISDDATATGDRTASSGTLVLTPTELTWSGSIPVGGIVTVTGNVLVNDPDLGNRLITGTLTSGAPGNNCHTGGTDPRCTAATTVLIPALTIEKTADTTTTTWGSTVTYTITVQDTGETPYEGATVDDSLINLLDEATYNADASATRGTVAYTSPNLSWTGDLGVGDTATITYSVTVNSSGDEGGDHTMVNAAVSTAAGSTCPAESSEPTCRSVIVILSPLLTIEKLADVPVATLGATVTFTVTVTNSGQVSYPAATFSDPLVDALDNATYNGDATATLGTLDYTDQTLTWTGALAPGEVAVVTYTLTVDSVTEGDRSLATTIFSDSSHNNCPVAAPDSRCTAIVDLVGSYAMTFTKTANVSVATHGQTVVYTVTADNVTGAGSSASFTDSLTGVLDDADYNDDVRADVGSVGVSGDDLTWSGTVPADSTATVTYSVTVHGATTGDQILDNTISSSLPTSSNDCLVAGDPRCRATVPVAALAVEHHYTQTSTTPGSIVRLSATFTNTGELPYVGISVSSPMADVVDDAVPNGDQTASSGTIVLDGASTVWTGNVPVGGSVLVTGTLTVQNPDPGNRLLSGTVSSEAIGNNCPPTGIDPLCTATLPVLLPQLTIAKSASTTFVVPGGTVGYTITIGNTGETAYVGAIATDDLTGALDDATYNANAVATIGAVSYSSPHLTWTGDLAVGQTATITYSVTAHSPDPGDKTVVNRVSSGVEGSTCPPEGGGSSCVSVVEVLTPGLTIAATASAQTSVPGASVGYTIVATNTGQVPYAAANLSIALAGVLDDAAYNGDASATSGTVGVAGQTLTWTGALSPGATATVSYSVTVHQPDTGNFQLDQTVVSTSQGSTCPSGGGDPRCATLVDIASMAIVNSADAVTTTPTSVVRNTVTVTNTGQVAYVGIVIRDSFVGSLDDATYNGDATATSGSLIIVTGSGQVVWTGDLPVGGSLTVTGSLTVNNPDVGNRLMTTRVTTDAPATNCPTSGPAATCFTSVTVLTPALTIAKTADTSVATPGDVVTYTIAVTNTGEAPYTAATVSDSLAGVVSDATYQNDASATSGVVTYSGTTLTWTGDLASGPGGAGQSVVISYSVKVNNPDLGGKVMANAVSSGVVGSTCPTGSTNPDCSAFVFVLVPALHITLSSDRSTTVPGGQVGYTVVITNDGQTGYVGANVSTLLTGDLDDASYAGDGTATSGILTYTAPTLLWSGDLAVGATTTISFSLTVADPDNGNRVLATSVSSPAPGGNCTTSDPCTNTVDVLIPGLAVSSRSDVATATPGQRVTFTTTLTNTGETAYVDTTFTTSLVSVLDDATFDGSISSTVGVATYLAPDLSWVGSLPAGTSAVITYSVVVASPDPGDKTLASTVVAPAQGSTCQADSADPACSVYVTVLVPALTIDKSADRGTTIPGGVVTYTIVMTNAGQTPYPAALVTDSLTGVLADAEYNADAVVTGGGILTYDSPLLTWTGDLAIGASATITYSITVNDPDPGDRHLVNRVTSDEPGSNCPSESADPMCTALVSVLVPILTVTKTADAESVAAGSSVTYTVTLHNGGETAFAPATFTDDLSGVLDDATYAGDASATSGTVGYADRTLFWSGPLAIGATATITYSVDVLYPVGGDLSLDNTVVSDSPGSDCASTGTNPWCRSIVVVLVPELSIVKTADASEVVAGGQLTYTIIATNTGEADYPAASLTDSLAGVLDDAAYGDDATATSGSVAYAAGTLAWDGALPLGASVIVTYSVTADVVDEGDAVLVNDVVSTSIGGTCPPASTAPECTTSVPVAPRTISLTDLTASFTLAGAPHTTVDSDGAVTMTVTTNSTGGYYVTVQSVGSSLTGAFGNPDSIPIQELMVRGRESDPFHGLSSTTSFIVNEADFPTGPGGDAVSNDFQIDIPMVRPDTYSTTLDYVAIAQ